MHIDKFVVLIKDVFSKKSKTVTVNADSVYEAHYKATPMYNEITQDIVKITNHEKEIVYTLERGFIF
jgi:uncharacterized protein YabN with tetrapyrrole methylase and pyrophosphatase domain